MENNEYLSVIEGMIFLSGDEGITTKQIAEVLGISKQVAAKNINLLLDYYEQKEIKGFEITNYGGYYKMVTLPQHHSFYEKMIKQNVARLSKAALETLAIVAYYQPITRIQIEEIRGVGCEMMIRKLLAKALIKEVGREETPGKPILYGITDEFLDAFQLTSLDELPQLKEVESDFDEEDIFNTKYKEKVSAS